MIKGIAQSERNNAWHMKHLKKRTKFNAHRISRVYNYVHGITDTNKNKKKAMEMMEKQLQKDLKVSFWERVKFLWRMSGLKAIAQIRKLFKPNQLSNA